MDTLSRGGEKVRWKEKTPFSLVPLSILSLPVPLTPWTAPTFHRGQSRWFISRYYPIMEFFFFFFSSKNSSPVKRRKYFKISLYKILCNNNIGVVRMASKRSRTNIFLLFLFWNTTRMKTRIKEELLNFFPNYLTIVFNTVKKILFSHAYCTLKREEEARMRQLIFIERGMEKKFALKLFFPFQFQFQFYFSIIKPLSPN